MNEIKTGKPCNLFQANDIYQILNMIAIIILHTFHQRMRKFIKLKIIWYKKSINKGICVPDNESNQIILKNQLSVI